MPTGIFGGTDEKAFVNINHSFVSFASGFS